ncbi:MAG: hypothetical protein Q7L55_05770 [Actinomycetota bacterium]|nr:hypothetical protein [Actinomycetota bacterium]
MKTEQRPPIDEELIVTSNQRLGRRVPDLIVRGRHEREILAMAPAMTCDRVHWSTVEPCDLPALVRDLGDQVWTRQWSDGQYRIWVPAGMGYQTRDRVRDWSQQHGVEIVNARVEEAVPFRDLDSIPDGLMTEMLAECTAWLFSRSYGIRRKLATELDLVQDEDVRSLMYLFIHDHADRFDADRTGRNGTLNFTAFMFGKIRTWPQDAARAAYGRTLVGDRIALHRANEAAMTASGRAASETDRALALGVTVTELRRRQDAISTLSNLRNYQEIIVGETDMDSVAAGRREGSSAGSDGPESYARAAAVTRALLDAVCDDDANSRRAQDPLALTCAYMTFWEGLNRAELARALEILPKTATAALKRALAQMDATELL